MLDLLYYRYRDLLFLCLKCNQYWLQDPNSQSEDRKMLKLWREINERIQQGYTNEKIKHKMISVDSRYRDLAVSSETEFSEFELPTTGSNLNHRFKSFI